MLIVFFSDPKFNKMNGGGQVLGEPFHVSTILLVYIFRPFISVLYENNVKTVQTIGDSSIQKNVVLVHFSNHSRLINSSTFQQRRWSSFNPYM